MFSFFFSFFLSPQILCALSFAGNRASEGRDGEMGQDFLLRGLADGFRGPVLTLLVQPLHGTELQEVPRGRRGSAGRDHRGERHRDPTGVARCRPSGTTSPLRARTAALLWRFTLSVAALNSQRNASENFARERTTLELADAC